MGNWIQICVGCFAHVRFENSYSCLLLLWKQTDLWLLVHLRGDIFEIQLVTCFNTLLSKELKFCWYCWFWDKGLEERHLTDIQASESCFSCVHWMLVVLSAHLLVYESVMSVPLSAQYCLVLCFLSVKQALAVSEYKLQTGWQSIFPLFGSSEHYRRYHLFFSFIPTLFFLSFIHFQIMSVPAC